MNAYIINLKESVERRRHMDSILRNYPEIIYSYVDAVDGKQITNDEINRRFNVMKSIEKYNRDIFPGEIGCTLSHQKCYQRLLESDKAYVLVLEDDVLFKEEFRDLIPRLDEIMSTSEPKIVLLSGMYWHYPFVSKKVNESYKIVHVQNAYLTSSYLINRHAAKLLIDEYPFNRADDWKQIQNRGVHVVAVKPHVIDQDWSGKFESTVYCENPLYKKNVGKVLFIHLKGLGSHFLKWIGCYEQA